MFHDYFPTCFARTTSFCYSLPLPLHLPHLFLKEGGTIVEPFPPPPYRCSTAPIDAPFAVLPAADIVAAFVPAVGVFAAAVDVVLVAAASVSQVGTASAVVAVGDVAAAGLSLVRHPAGEEGVAAFCLLLTTFCHSLKPLGPDRTFLDPLLPWMLLVVAVAPDSYWGTFLTGAPWRHRTSSEVDDLQR